MTADTKRLVPISKVIAAAMVDSYVDISQAGTQQMFYHWGSRGYIKINNEVLKLGKRKVTVTINKNTHTGTLPLDFYQESFVGIIQNDKKYPLTMRTDLVDTDNIEEIECDDKCPKCSQNTNICKELSVSESTVIVVINNNTYEQTIIKKLYPNGDYFIETRTPVLNTESIVPEVQAVGYIDVIIIGDPGGTMEVFILGQSLGIYEIGDNDLTLNETAISIAKQFNGIYGYEFSVSGARVTVTGAPGLGASLNTGTNITATLIPLSTGTGGLGTLHSALAITITQFSGGVNAIGLTGAKVEYVTQKEFVKKLDLKDCGCLAETPSNIDFVKTNNYDCYCNYFTSCCNDVVQGSYQIFEETGLIKLNSNFNYDKVYLEYQGFLPKKNGQYQVPEIAFETLVQWIKWKSVENKKSVSRGDKQDAWTHYVIERRNMEKLNGRMTIEQIVQSMSLIPKFDISWEREDNCFAPTTPPVPTVIDSCSTNSIACAPTSGKSFTPFSILTAAGNSGTTPTVGINTYQDDRLKGAIGINQIIINDTTFTRNAFLNQSVKDFDIDINSGVLSVWQGDGVSGRLWEAGDVLIIPTFFKLI